MTKTNLKQLLTTDTILDHAGEIYFARGANYFTDGVVKDLSETNGVIKARVSGTRDYRTKIWVDKNNLEYSCSCPLGQEYQFCKHLVATGLAWLDTRQVAPQKLRPSTKKKTKKRNVFDSIRDYLETLPQKQLVDIIIEQTTEHSDLRNLLYAQSTVIFSSAEEDLEVHKQFIRTAIEVDDFIDYRRIYDYVQTVEPVVELLENLFKQGRFEDVLELAEFSLPLIFDAYNNMDDDGYFSAIPEEVAALHLKASKKAKSDPEQLAKSLFALQMQDGWCLVDFRNYQKVLGKKGMQAFKDLAQQQWRKVPKRTQRNSYGFDSKRYSITEIMSQLAELDNDTDAKVAIQQKDLSTPSKYLEIARSYAKAKRHDEALQWAQNGIKAFPNQHSSGLTEFIAQEYHRRKQDDKAQQLMWEEFTRSPNINGYQALKESASKTKAWEFWRTKAIKWIAEEYLTGKRKGSRGHPGYKPNNHSILVEIHLYEKDVAQALQTAKAGGCADHLWFQLAKASESTFPQEAVNIYRSRVDDIINQANKKAYRQAVHLLKTIKDLMSQLGKTKQFNAYINQLRNEHIRKRNFLIAIKNL